MDAQELLDKYNSQWVSFHIRDHLKDGQVLIQNTVIEGGEFEHPTNRRRSLSEDEVDEMTIPSYGVGEITARSRRGSEGRLDLFHDNNKICEIHWENRGGEYPNLVELLDSSDKYRIEYGGWSPEAGPLGHVYVDISERKEK
ncbi:Aegerolysin [Penicillium chermesinum]|uniref:Aegerolysin n=1 Tax=Penicillium chermesinum TaxID=63820 RepID=A0A9W9NP70_9EURO|nr:Aegerolysin [Penicillium chermesinum]KAJ5223436.1 Aegerolysin [Penicillium chermesinum]